MSVPSSWAQTTVGELFEVVGGGTPSTAVEEYWTGDIPWISSADIDDRHNIDTRRFITREAIENSATNVVPAGSVIVVTRVGLGKVAIAPTVMCFSQDSQALIPRGDVINQKYVLLYLSTAVSVFRHISRGTTISGVTKKQLLELPFILPPKAEQDRIVQEVEALVTDLDAALAAVKRVQANLKRYRASVLKAACEGRLVPTEAELARKEGRSYETGEQLLARILKERRAKWEADQLAKMLAAGKPPKNDDWKKKYKAPTQPDITNLPELPEGWTIVNLGQLSWSVKDGPHYSPKYSDHGVPFITGGQVRPSGVDFDSAKYISPELHRELSERCKPEKGDVLYTKGGTTGIARVNTYDTEFNVWVHVAVLKLLGSIEPFYVQHALNSPPCYAQAQKYTHGVGNQDLGLTRMVWITFGMPPLEEQRRIVEEVERRLSGLAEMERTLDVEIKRADRLRQAILKRAFEGKLVPQDPNDEPASVLLARLRAERAARASIKAVDRRKLAAVMTEK